MISTQKSTKLHRCIQQKFYPWLPKRSQMSPNMSKENTELDQEIIAVTGLAKSAENGLGISNFLQPPISTSSPSSDPNNCFNRMVNKAITVVKWVIRDFKLRHLVSNFSLTRLVKTNFKKWASFVNIKFTVLLCKTTCPLAWFTTYGTNNRLLGKVHLK